MGSLSPWHLMILAVLALLLFGGRGKLSGIMGDAAKGIRAFKDGLKDDHEAEAAKSAATQASATPLPTADKDKEPIVR